MKKPKTALRRALSLLGALGFALAAALPVCAATKPSADVAVVDDAGILSRQTETYVTNISIALQDTCGAQIGVYTTDYIGNSTMEGFAYNIYNQWGLGSAQADNGVLLLLASGEDDYYVMRGEGLERDLSVSIIGTILDDEMEKSWVNGDYDGGTQKTVRALAERLCSIYGVTMDLDAVGTGQSTTGTAQSSSGGLSVGGVFLIALAVMLIIVMLVFLLSRGGRRGPPPPPRSGFGSSFGGAFMGSMLGNSMSRRRRRYPPPPPHGGFGGYGTGPRPGGGFSSPPRPSGGFGARPSGTGRSSGGFSGGVRPSGGSFRAGGGSTRGGGVGRRH